MAWGLIGRGIYGLILWANRRTSRRIWINRRLIRWRVNWFAFVFCHDSSFRDSAQVIEERG